MKRAAAVMAVCWAAAVVWAVAGRASWRPPRAEPVSRPVIPARVRAMPADRTSPLPAAVAAAAGGGGAVTAAARVGDCRPQPVSVGWDGPDRATVELDCTAILALAGGQQVPVARTWQIGLVWQAGRWRPVSSPR